MYEKSRALALCTLTLIVVLGGTTRGALVGHWKLDETSGTVAADSSGNGLNGTVQGGAVWVAGKVGGALQTDGTDDYVELGNPAALDLSGAGQATIAAWVQPAVTKNHNAIFTKGEWKAAYSLLIKGDTSPANLLWTGNDTSVFSADPVPLGEWTHVAVTIRGDLTNFYINGRLNGPADQDRGEPIDNSVRTAAIGREDRNGSSPRWYFNGLLDDVRVYNEALPEEQIQTVMLGRDSGAGRATHPVPEDGQTDVPCDTTLSWTPGPFAVAHDVYFGTSRADVNTATTDQPRGVLASAGQDANTFEPPERLAFGQIYWWRVDEVNAAPDNTVFPGDVWSFTTEPYVYPLTNVKATASSSFSTDTGPEKTVDGSGMDANDLHGTADDTMWLSQRDAPGPVWLRYEFAQTYKLNKMLAWNFNSRLEGIAGLGAREVVVEYSRDGSDWTVLPDVPLFAQAPGTAGYASDITVPFGNRSVKYVRLTINSNWGSMTQAGLSEVRFYYVPVRAREPEPASGQENVNPNNVVLRWRPGREAVSHQVYLSEDPQAVADGTALVGTTDAPRYTPPGLDLSTRYYWKVIEVNEAASPAEWESDVWDFSTASVLIIDDFESYNDEDESQGMRIYQTWIDGYADQSSGSVVGNWDPPFAERTVVHGGRQSMPLSYDNSSYPTSEAQRAWKTPQDWTTNGADTLTLCFRGNPVGFLELASDHILMNGVGTDIYSTADQGRFVYKQLTGDGSIIARVDRLDNTDAWAKAGVMIRQGLDASAPWVYVLWAGENGVRFQMRPTIGGAGDSDTPVATPEQIALRTPVWIKLERKGDQFNGYYATDSEGEDWMPMVWNPRTLSMNAGVYIGLAVTSHAAGVATQAEFSNIVTTSSVTGAWESASLTVDQPAGNRPDRFYLALEDAAGHKATVVHPDPLAVLAGTWTPWSIPLSEFTSAGVQTGSIKKMTIGIGDGTKPASGASGLLYIDDIGYGKTASQ
jgi:hypothetical protein